MQLSPEHQSLVEQYVPYAHRIASTVFSDLPSAIPRDDLLAAAQDGLIEAAQRYDPTRGIKFETFAYYRIRGAVFDHARQYCAAHPGLTGTQKQLAAQSALDDTIETVFGQPVYDAQPDQMQLTAILSEVLDTAASSFSITAQVVTLPETSEEIDLEQSLITQQANDHIREIVASLPEKERTIIQEVYFEGRTIEEAGSTIGLSKVGLVVFTPERSQHYKSVSPQSWN